MYADGTVLENDREIGTLFRISGLANIVRKICVVTRIDIAQKVTRGEYVCGKYKFL